MFVKNENIILTTYIHKNTNYKAVLPIVRLTNIRAEICKAFSLPTVFVCPFSAAIIKGVFPEESTAFTWALWLSRSCRHSTWSVKAAAWRGVLQQIKRQYGHVQPCLLLYLKWHPDCHPADTEDWAVPPTDLWSQYCLNCDCCLQKVIFKFQIIPLCSL